MSNKFPTEAGKKNKKNLKFSAQNGLLSLSLSACPSSQSSDQIIFMLGFFFLGILGKAQSCVSLCVCKAGLVWLSGWVLLFYPPSESTSSDLPKVSWVWLNLFHLHRYWILFSFLNLFFSLSLSPFLSLSHTHGRTYACMHARTHTQVKMLEQRYLKHTRVLKTPWHA